MEYHVDLTNGLSGPAAEMEASMVSLRASIISTHGALKAFEGPSTKAAAQMAAIQAKGNQARILAETKAAGQIAAINAKAQQARALVESKAGAGLLAAREKMAGADLAQRNKAMAALIMQQAKGDAAIAKAAKVPGAKLQAKDKAAANDKAEKSKAAKPVAAKAKPDPKAKSDDGKKSEDLKKLGSFAAKGAAALVAVGLAATAAGLKMGFPLAMGYRGMAKLQMISARASLDIRKLFSGVDPAPVIRAAEKFVTMFSKTTSTGRVLSDVIGRIFNGLFGLIESAQPYITAFAQGMIYGFLTVENAYLKVRIAAVPFLGSLNQMVGTGQLMKVAFYAGAIVMGLLAVATVAAISPFIALGLAIEKVIGLYNEWTGNTVTLKKAPKPGGTGGASSWDTAGGKEAGPSKDAAGLAGQSAGMAMGDGLVKGIEAKLGAATAAGVALGTAADTGVKTAGEIKSPSRKMRRSGGYMGQGLALGLQDSEGDVQKAAANSLVPDLGKAPLAGPKAAGKGSDGSGLTINFNGPVSGSVEDFEGAVRRVWLSDMRDVVLNLGAAV